MPTLPSHPDARRHTRAALLAALAVPGIVAGLAGPAGATGEPTTTSTTPTTEVAPAPRISGLTVTPSTGLRDGSTVHVQATVEPGTRYGVSLCSTWPVNDPEYSCVNVAGDWIEPDHATLDMKLRLPAIISEHPHLVDCRAFESCTLLVRSHPEREPEAVAHVPVSFVPHGPATSPSATKKPKSAKPGAVRATPRYTG